MSSSPITKQPNKYRHLSVEARALGHKIAQARLNGEVGATFTIVLVKGDDRIIAVHVFETVGDFTISGDEYYPLEELKIHDLVGMTYAGRDSYKVAILKTLLEAVEADFDVPEAVTSPGQHINIHSLTASQVAIANQGNITQTQAISILETIKGLRQTFKQLGIDDPQINHLLQVIEDDPSEVNLRTHTPQIAYKAMEIIATVQGAGAGLYAVWAAMDFLTKQFT